MIILNKKYFSTGIVFVFRECSDDFINSHIKDWSPEYLQYLDDMNGVTGAWTMFYRDEAIMWSMGGPTMPARMLNDGKYYFFKNDPRNIYFAHNVNFGKSRYEAFAMEWYFYSAEIFLPFPTPQFPIWLEKSRDHLVVYTETEEDAMQLRLLL